MKSLGARINVKDYEIQTNIFKFLMKAVAITWVLIVIMAVVNRYTYTRKHIETEYIYANLTELEIKNVKKAGEAIFGDDHIIKTYLATYVRNRESRFARLDGKKMDFIGALSSPNVFNRYNDKEREEFAKNKNYIIEATINPEIKKLDEGLYQVKFETREKTIGEKKEYRSSQVATLRYRIKEYYNEEDYRLKIPDFERLNPLSIEVTIYSTANYQYEKRK